MVAILQKKLSIYLKLLNYPQFKKLLPIKMRLKKKIVIIGARGFVGEYLTNGLKKRGNVSLTLIDKNEESGQLEDNIDCLVLLYQPDLALTKNITKHELGIKKIVFASTLLLYPDSDIKQKEEYALDPLTDYEKNKLAEENLLSNYAQKSQTKLCIIRFANIYGDVKNRGIIQKILNAILTAEKFTINGSGNQKRDYLFIEDAIRILESLIFVQQKKSVEVFNVCNGKSYSTHQLITAIETLTKKKLLIVQGPGVKEKVNIVGNNQKVTKFTKQKPIFNLKKGLLKTYQNYLRQAT